MLPMLLFHSRVTPIFMGRSSAGQFPTPVEPSFILIATPSLPPQAWGVIARLATETSHTRSCCGTRRSAWQLQKRRTPSTLRARSFFLRRTVTQGGTLVPTVVLGSSLGVCFTVVAMREEMY